MHPESCGESASPGSMKPQGMPLMRMQWRHLLFMHWRIEPGVLRPLVPHANRLEIDTFDGTAWVGLIPFTMRCVQPWATPALPVLSDLPGVTAFHECNVRTYVTCDGVPGVWFFSLDAASRLAVWGARKFFHLPYHRALMSLDRHGDETAYSTVRCSDSGAAMRCRWRVGRSLPTSTPGSLPHFLTERYCLYSTDAAGQVYRGWIDHQPWPLHHAEVLDLEDGLVRAAGISIDRRQSPLVHSAETLSVAAQRLHRV